ncbi:MAG: hypothetical protein CVV05_15455 [Gammaproteobacteria bacterium HGW-Gammaproteobacteria-1]|jgi:hypothetical protein|nr:MAG: hypothetical protein CVV05_15455 [Gammaproteobacteria bacterium HGW-Gammaproteobacteria-1]
MKPSLLINAQIAAITRKGFTVGEHRPVTLFAAGLAGAEKVTLQLLTNDEDPDGALADNAAWTDYEQSGTTKVLDANNSVIVIDAPGEYAVLTEAATAGAIRVGVYGG